MADLIDREAALDAIAKTYVRGESIGYAVAEDILYDVPSEDAVPVVRCKDCTHYQFADNRAFGFPVKRCEWTGFEDVDDMDFCSRGERKDGKRHESMES